MGSAAAGPCCQRPFRAFTDVIFLGRATAGLKLGTIGLRSLRQHDRGPQTAWSYNTPSHRTPRPHATHRGYQFQFLSRISPVNPRDPGAVALTTPHHKETAGETEGFPAPARLCLRGLLQKQAQSERTVSPGTVSIAVSGLADETR